MSARTQADNKIQEKHSTLTKLSSVIKCPTRLVLKESTIILRLATLLSLAFFLISCIVAPKTTHQKSVTCELSTDRKTLRVVNLAKQTNSYYSLEGLIATPIIYPATALVSGAYAAAYNVYSLSKEQINCSKKS